MNAASLIDAALAQGGFDASRSVVLSVLNERYQEIVADARWNRQDVAVATTVSGTSKYSLADSVIEVFRLKVGAYRYSPIGQDQMWDLQASTVVAWTARGGLFCPQFDASGNSQIELYPTPTSSGDTITAYAAVAPADLTDSSGSSIGVPVDFHGKLLDGVISTLLTRYDERPDLAQGYEQRFREAVEKLRRRKNSRVGSGSPVQIQVEGIHYPTGG